MCSVGPVKRETAVAQPPDQVAPRSLQVIGGRDDMVAADPAGLGLQAVGDGKMWVDARFRSKLDRGGLVSIGAVMATTDGRCLRTLADRENWHLQLHDAHQQLHGVYLKKHHVRTWRSWLRAKLQLGPGKTAGYTEARNAQELSDEGIDCIRVLAYGEQLLAGGLVESFVLTDELTGYTQLDHFLPARFPVRETKQTAPRDRDLARLIRQVAQIARKLHAAGYNHRDLYCCHFFIKEMMPGRFDIKLIDLQRVQHRRRFRRRWLVKDLAQLAWSATRPEISCAQKMAFMRHYLGVRRLRPRDKRFIRRVLSKQRRMERRLGPAP